MSAPTDTFDFDATKQPLGRLASRIATVLQGKHLPSYQPSRLAGVRVVVWNASAVVLTGSKATQAYRYRHSGYPGGLKRTRLGDVRATRPERLIHDAVRRMLPKNKLQPLLLKALSIHRGPKTS